MFIYNFNYKILGTECVPINCGASWWPDNLCTRTHTEKTEVRSTLAGPPLADLPAQKMSYSPSFQFFPPPWSCWAWAFSPYFSTIHTRPFLWNYHFSIVLPYEMQQQLLWGELDEHLFDSVLLCYLILRISWEGGCFSSILQMSILRLNWHI